jgi:hypothetical protein
MVTIRCRYDGARTLIRSHSEEQKYAFVLRPIPGASENDEVSNVQIRFAHADPECLKPGVEYLVTVAEAAPETPAV